MGTARTELAQSTGDKTQEIDSWTMKRGRNSFFLKSAEGGHCYLNGPHRITTTTFPEPTTLLLPFASRRRGN